MKSEACYNIYKKCISIYYCFVLFCFVLFCFVLFCFVLFYYYIIIERCIFIFLFDRIAFDDLIDTEMYQRLLAQVYVDAYAHSILSYHSFLLLFSTLLPHSGTRSKMTLRLEVTSFFHALDLLPQLSIFNLSQFIR